MRDDNGGGGSGAKRKNSVLKNSIMIKQTKKKGVFTRKRVASK